MYSNHTGTVRRIIATSAHNAGIAEANVYNRSFPFASRHSSIKTNLTAGSWRRRRTTRASRARRRARRRCWRWWRAAARSAACAPPPPRPPSTSTRWSSCSGRPLRRTAASPPSGGPLRPSCFPIAKTPRRQLQPTSLYPAPLPAGDFLCAAGAGLAAHVVSAIDVVEEIVTVFCSASATAICLTAVLLQALAVLMPSQ